MIYNTPLGLTSGIKVEYTLWLTVGAILKCEKNLGKSFDFLKFCQVTSLATFVSS